MQILLTVCCGCCRPGIRSFNKMQVMPMGLHVVREEPGQWLHLPSSLQRPAVAQTSAALAAAPGPRQPGTPASAGGSVQPGGEDRMGPRTGEDLRGQERTPEDRRGQARTGQDPRGQARTAPHSDGDQPDRQACRGRLHGGSVRPMPPGESVFTQWPPKVLVSFNFNFSVNSRRF